MSFQNNRRRIVVIEGQLRAFNKLDLLLPHDVFKPNTGPVQAQAELDTLIIIRTGQRNRILSLAEHHRKLIVQTYLTNITINLIDPIYLLS